MADILKNRDFPQWTAPKLIALSGAYWKTGALHAAVKLGVFSLIASQPQTAKVIAQKLGADQRALAILLNALSAMNLLIKTNDTYANTPESLAYLSQDSDRYIGYMIMHHHNLMPSWIQLDKAVKEGGPLRTKAAQSDSEGLENFLLGMFNMAMNLAPGLAKEISLSGKTRLLDLGGGPGTYAIQFCINNPGLTATVCDLAATEPFAQKIIKKFGLSDRINFSAVNFLKEDIPGAYDVAWLSHILHGEGQDACQEIVQKAVAVLKPGGMIIIHDFILDDAMDSPLFAALFSLNMLLGTDSGQSYSQTQITDMLANAGVKKIKRGYYPSLTDSGIILGVV